MAHIRIILFRIFYSTSFTLVFLTLLTFISISSADALYWSWKRRRLIDIFIIAGVYIVTALLAALIYASRLYTTRSVLREIPKTYIPLEREDLPGKRTWRLISGTVQRSAVVSLLSRPRARRIEVELGDEGRARIEGLLRPEMRKNGEDKEVKTHWGVIAHRGWSSPADEELPDLQFDTVISELPDLLEAKAVSLAPVHDEVKAEDGLPVPDVKVVEAVSRPEGLGLRAYVRMLVEIGVVQTGDGAEEGIEEFLELYERSRFSGGKLLKEEFVLLMRLFGDMLRGMRSPELEGVDLSVRGDGSERRSIGKSSLRSEHRSDADASSISGSVRRYGVTPRRSSGSSSGSVRVVSKGEG